MHLLALSMSFSFFRCFTIRQSARMYLCGYNVFVCVTIHWNFSIYRWLFDFQKCDVIANATHNTNFPFIPTRCQRSREKINYITHFFVFRFLWRRFFFLTFDVYIAPNLLFVSALINEKLNPFKYIERMHFHRCQTDFLTIAMNAIYLPLELFLTFVMNFNFQIFKLPNPFLDMASRLFTFVGLMQSTEMDGTNRNYRFTGKTVF